jgi:hypothetical protein
VTPEGCPTLKSNIELAVREDLGFEVEANPLECETLTFIDGRRERNPERKLDPAYGCPKLLSVGVIATFPMRTCSPVSILALTQ